MAVFTMNEIAKIVGGKILQGDGNREIEKFSTNSKEGDDRTLFVPVIGERVDAHDFIGNAYENGMRCTFTMRDEIVDDTDDMTYIKVDQSVAALQMVGADYRARFTDLPLIGITGSVGKTTTKEMIAAALETKKCVLKTDKNMNSQVGLPQMMARIEEKHEIAVIEMGMSEFGEMKRLCDVAKPNFAVMTNIGVSHIGQLKTQENIRSEKANICNHFTKDSVLLVNGDDRLLRELYDVFENPKTTDKEKTQLIDTMNLSAETLNKLKEAKIATFGTDCECTVYATEIETVGESTRFMYNYTDRDGIKKQEAIELSVLGLHNVLNALAALYIADYYGIEPKIAKEGLKAYQPISMRGGIEKVNEITVIDDTYNASPDSMKGAINILLELPKENRKIIVFADILELGEISESCHYEVGEYLANHSLNDGKSPKSIDVVITIGEEAKFIAKAVKEHNAAIEVHSFATKEEAGDCIQQVLQPKDAILFKGSRGMKLEVLVNLVKKG